MKRCSPPLPTTAHPLGCIVSLQSASRHSRCSAEGLSPLAGRWAPTRPGASVCRVPLCVPRVWLEAWPQSVPTTLAGPASTRLVRGHTCAEACVAGTHVKRATFLSFLQAELNPAQSPAPPPHQGPPNPPPVPGWGSLVTGAPVSPEARVCTCMCGHSWACTCVWGSPRSAAPLSAASNPLHRPKMRGTTTSSMSCWLGCPPSSGRPSACRRPRPTTT